MLRRGWIHSELHRLPAHHSGERGWSVTDTTTVALPATGERRVPRLLVGESAVPREAREWQVAAGDVLLAGETASMSTVLRDRENKPVVGPLDGEGSATVFAAQRAGFGAAASSVAVVGEQHAGRHRRTGRRPAWPA